MPFQKTNVVCPHCHRQSANDQVCTSLGCRKRINTRSRAYSTDGQLSFGYGIGFMLYRQGDVIAVGHGGSVAGYVGGAYYNAPSPTGLNFLRNAAGRRFRNDVVMAAVEALSR
jgi:hypothetical protein